MFGLFRKKAVPGDFWAWLAENTARIQRELARNSQRIAEEVGDAFKQSYPDLVYEVTVSKSGPWVFCVSAEGNRALFPQVIQAVEAAPVIPGWDVQAFRQRGPLTAEIKMGERTLGYDDIWCGVRPKNGGVHVVLCVRGMTPDLDPLLSPAALILLDNAVGEYDAAMKIAQLDRGPLPPNPQRRPDFFPLSELPAYLDGIPGGA